MPVRTTIEDDLVTFHLEGEFDTDALLHAGREVRSDPALRRPVRLLFDATGSAMSAGHEEIIARVGRLAALRGEFVPRVGVVVAGELHYGLTRVHDGYASSKGIRIRPFRTREEALAWIDRGGDD